MPILCSPCSAPPNAGEPTDSSPSEIPVSTPNAGERLREARRYTAGYCEGLRTLSEYYCDTIASRMVADSSRNLSLFFLFFSLLPSRCGSLSPRRSIGRQALGGGLPLRRPEKQLGRGPLQRGVSTTSAANDQHRTTPNAHLTAPWPMGLGWGVSGDSLSATFMPRLCVYGRLLAPPHTGGATGIGR